MTGRVVALAALALFLMVVGFGGLIATADMEPCWPNCAATSGGGK